MLSYSPARLPRHAARAMTLVEVLFTLGIMAIGMVSVASIFPVAAKLQDDASSEVEADQVARNAEALIKAKGIRVSSNGGDNQWNPSQAGNNIADNSPFTWTAGPMTVAPCFSIRDRSYPSSLYNMAGATLALQTSQCDFFWVPLVRDADPRLGRSEPQAAVFVMHRAAAAPTGTVLGAINSSDAPNGVPVPEVVQTTTISMATTSTPNGMQIGDLALYGPVPLGALSFQWVYGSSTVSGSTTPVSEVKLTDAPASSSTVTYNRDDPSAYANSPLFAAQYPYAQVFSGTRGVTYRIVLVSGDLLLEK
jgi:type II secretory pathway pseudopilin PulG